jgi:hypothetical protein
MSHILSSRFPRLFISIFPDTKLTDHETNEKEVAKIFTEVAVSRREAEIVSKKKVF